VREEEEAGRPGVRKSVFPVLYQDMVFVFDAPPPGRKYLHLEIPTTPWGGKGAFRFTIPASLIREKGEGPAGR
jgi:hypothetical protein